MDYECTRADNTPPDRWRIQPGSAPGRIPVRQSSCREDTDWHPGRDPPDRTIYTPGTAPRPAGAPPPVLQPSPGLPDQI